MIGTVLGAFGHALALTGSMTWEILWALILGFALSAVVQAVVRRSTIVSLMGDDRPRTLAAAGLGAASSSCSYAAVARARSLFRKDANFTAAMVAAGYLVELIFGAANLIPTQRNATVMQAEISWNYTTWLNIVFLVIAAMLVVRFFTSGGIPMLRMMGGSPDAQPDHHDHSDHSH